MMSKSSFWVSLKENNKRRVVVWLMSFLSFILFFPTAAAMRLKVAERRLPAMIEYYGEAAAREMIRQEKLDAVNSLLGFSVPAIFLVSGFAVVSAFHGFAWLNSKKKVDFYLGMPVKRSKRFWTIWLNGLLSVLIPYAIGLAVSFLIAALNGAANGQILTTMLMAFGAFSCLCLCVYHLAVLAVALTGNNVIGGMGFLVFCLYEFLVRLVIDEYQRAFFRYKSAADEMGAPVFSPFMMIARLMEEYEKTGGHIGRHLAPMLLFAAVAGALAYISFLYRPAEAAGKAMAFGWMQTPIKILLTVPASLCVGMMIYEILNISVLVSPGEEKDWSGIGFLLFGMAISVVLLSALFQVIYEFDIRAALHKKRHIAVSGLLSACAFLFFLFDLGGYDAYVPDPEQVESAAFIPQTDYTTVGYIRYDAEGEKQNLSVFTREYMILTDVEDVCELAETAMDIYENYDFSVPGEALEKRGRFTNAELIYRMKNGRKVCRKIYINLKNEETMQLVDRITGTEEFKECWFEGITDNLEKGLAKADKVTAAYTNTVYEQTMGREELGGFLAAYRKDMAQADFGDIRRSIPEGVISLEMQKVTPVYTQTAATNIAVWSFCENSILWLQNHGYGWETQLNAEDVEQIMVCNYNPEMRKRLEKVHTSGGYSAVPEAVDEKAVDTRVYAAYKDAESILKISGAVAPDALMEYKNCNPYYEDDVQEETEYTVLVYFKPDSKFAKNGNNLAYYQFCGGQVPAFVQEETVYK